MGIRAITIRNYKSINYLKFDFDRESYDIQALVGKNGAGKSNLLKAIRFFYLNMTGGGEKDNVAIDCKNPYVEKLEIEIIFDFEMLNINNSNPYITNLLDQIEQYKVEEKILLKMTQYKDGNIKWFPEDINIRRAILKFFPMYIVDTRFITLDDWSELWEIISELSISTVKISQKDLIDKLDQLFAEVYGEKYSKTLNRIMKVFEREEIAINSTDYNIRFKNALLTRLGGNDFLSEDNVLSYYSDGLNSLKYIKLCIQLISSLANTGWKNPLILIDEPEIGLHPQYIELLSDCINENMDKRLTLLLSSHSPLLISKLIKSERKICIHRVFQSNGYSRIEKLSELVDANEKYLITEKETGCYFAEAIIFVEGKSELQVFQNPSILKLFPKLKKIKLHNFDSDNSSLKVAHPDSQKFTIPYIVMVDMDKIIKYSSKKEKFVLNRDALVNPLYDKSILRKQKFYFYKKGGRKSITYNLRQRIYNILNNSKFSPGKALYCLNENFYVQLLSLIKVYCEQYHVYPVETTIEGCIVNFRTYKLVIEWLTEEYLDVQTIKLLNQLLDKKTVSQKLSLLRLILNGKTDMLLTLKEASTKYIAATIKSDIQKLQKNIGGKTDGWISLFIQYYFKRIIYSKKDIDSMKKQFQEDFQEISYILHLIQNMVN